MKRRLFAGFTLFAVLIALAVSSHAALDNKEYTNNEDGTFTDTTTGLTWQNPGDRTQRNWQDAIDYCNNNTARLPGSGWRLPTIEELNQIRSASVLRYAYTDWSASSSESNPNEAWVMYYENAIVYTTNKTRRHFARCVRY